MRLLSLLATITFSVPALAQEPPKIQPVPEGEDLITSVKKGQPAPYAGQLFSPPTALRWANYIVQYRDVLRIELAHERLLREAEVDLWRKKYDASESRYHVVTLDYQGQVAKLTTKVGSLERAAESPPFYRTVWFGITLGAVMTGALVGAAIVAVN